MVDSKACETFSSSGSSTTVRIRTPVSVEPQNTMDPPKAHETLLLGCIHFGGRPELEDNPSIECTCTFRSKDAVEIMPRLMGDHCTSYRRCWVVASPNMLCSLLLACGCCSSGSLGTSPIGCDVYRSHKIVRLSLPHLFDKCQEGTVSVGTRRYNQIAIFSLKYTYDSNKCSSCGHHAMLKMP
jgi:hypothetical protein